MLCAPATQAVMESERQVQDSDGTRVVGNRLEYRRDARVGEQARPRPQFEEHQRPDQGEDHMWTGGALAQLLNGERQQHRHTKRGQHRKTSGHPGGADDGSVAEERPGGRQVRLDSADLHEGAERQHGEHRGERQPAALRTPACLPRGPGDRQQRHPPQAGGVFNRSVWTFAQPRQPRCRRPGMEWVGNRIRKKVDPGRAAAP